MRSRQRQQQRQQDDEADSTPRGIVSACAFEGAGKTTFALTAQKPIHYITIDANTEEIVRKEITEGRLKKSDISLHRVSMPAALFGDPDDVKDRAADIWEDEFKPALMSFLDADPDDRAKTVVLDTATELRELELLKFFGRTAQILPEMYTKPNMLWKGLIMSLKRSGANVILLHRLKDVYETRTKRSSRGKEEVREKVPGVYEREGFNKTGPLVNAEVHLLFDRTRHEKIEACFGMKVVRSTNRPGLIGEEYWGRAKQEDGSRIRRATFPYLMVQLYPETSLTDWQ